MRSLERWPLVEGGLILLAAVLCLAFQARLPSLLPNVGDYEQARAVLEAEGKPGDVLLLYPWWAERARLFAPRQLKVVGYQGSDGDPLEQHPRIWVLSQPELPRSSWSDFWATFGDRRSPLGSERRFGRLHLGLYQNGRHQPVRFSMVDSLSQAQAYVERADGSRVPCAWDGRSHQCGGGSSVAAEWHEVRFQPRRCLKLYPPGGDAKLVVELTGVPASDQIVLYAGMIWDRGYFKESRFSKTHVEVETDGKSATAIDIAPGQFGLHRASGPATRQGSTVRVWSQAQSPELREVCVEVYGYQVGSP